MIKTENFNPISDPKLLCTCGHEKCNRKSVRQFVLNQVQKMRDDIKRPIIITSGGRCSNHPNEIYKEKAGDHQQGFAVDIACDSPELETKLKVLAGRHGATRVAGGWEDGFVHCAWTPTNRIDVPTWSYS